MLVFTTWMVAYIIMDWNDIINQVTKNWIQRKCWSYGYKYILILLVVPQLLRVSECCFVPAHFPNSEYIHNAYEARAKTK